MKSYEISEVICLKCLNRWIAVYPEQTLLKDLECKCGEVGSVIKTGQTLPDIPDEVMESDIRYQNMKRMWGEYVAREKYRAFILQGGGGINMNLDFELLLYASGLVGFLLRMIRDITTIKWYHMLGCFILTIAVIDKLIVLCMR